MVFVKAFALGFVAGAAAVLVWGCVEVIVDDRIPDRLPRPKLPDIRRA